MTYASIVAGEFIERPNRFIAKVKIDGQIHTVHVKNTGRCKELLIPGARVYLSIAENPSRKTAYDLICVEKITDRGSILINMDSAAPNDAVAEWLRGGLFSKDASVSREVRFGNSRFDFFVEDAERRAFVEVKGVTLEKDGICAFPDAPTERGVKHIDELCRCIDLGYEACIVFVVQMKGAQRFVPNTLTHAEFASALRRAAMAGVKILAYDCLVSPGEMKIDSAVAVDLFEKFNK